MYPASLTPWRASLGRTKPDSNNSIRHFKRAPTFCKACLKKSTSIILFARIRFSLVISLRRRNSRERGLTWIALIESVTPVIQQPAVYAEFPRQPEDIVARIHSLDGFSPKFLTVPLSFFPFHFATPFVQSVH